MESFILALFFMLPNGDLHIAHEGKPSAIRMTYDECNVVLAERLNEGRKKIPWVLGVCVPVPGEPEVQQEAPKKIDRNNI